MKHFFLYTTLLFFPCVLMAQQNLPYLSGYDNTAEQAGWVEYRLGVTSTFNWSIAGFGAPSPPNLLNHDYPVGASGTDTTEDWYVSPVLNFIGSSKMSLKFNVYSIAGSNQPVDEFGIWYSSTGADPATNVYTKVTELKDYVSTSFVFTDTSGIIIPSVVGTGYIAFKYKAVQNWFVISVDDIRIESVFGASVTAVETKLFPSSVILSSGNSKMKNPFAINGDMVLCDMTGKKVAEQNHLQAKDLIEIPALSAGVYFLSIKNSNTKETLRLIIQN